jgi:hypothetical protein
MRAMWRKTCPTSRRPPIIAIGVRTRLPAVRKRAPGGDWHFRVAEILKTGKPRALHLLTSFTPESTNRPSACARRARSQPRSVTARELGGLGGGSNQSPGFGPFARCSRSRLRARSDTRSVLLLRVGPHSPRHSLEYFDSPWIRRGTAVEISAASRDSARHSDGGRTLTA